MRVMLFMGGFVLLVGCGNSGDNTGDVASLCGVSVAEVEQATTQAKNLGPNNAKRLGSCDVLIDERGLVSIGPIQKQPSGR